MQFGVPPQTPAVHVSGLVQLSPSLHGLPVLFGGFEQPVSGSQVPASWHWSSGLHVIGFEPLQMPPVHVSVCVQTLPSSQPLPSPSCVQTDGSPVQEWHSSTWHVALQPSPGVVPPSSQVSGASITPSPQ